MLYDDNRKLPRRLSELKIIIFQRVNVPQTLWAISTSAFPYKETTLPKLFIAQLATEAPRNTQELVGEPPVIYCHTCLTSEGGSGLVENLNVARRKHMLLPSQVSSWEERQLAYTTSVPRGVLSDREIIYATTSHLPHFEFELMPLPPAVRFN